MKTYALAEYADSLQFYFLLETMIRRATAHLALTVAPRLTSVVIYPLNRSLTGACVASLQIVVRTFGQRQVCNHFHSSYIFSILNYTCIEEAGFLAEWTRTTSRATSNLKNIPSKGHQTYISDPRLQYSRRKASNTISYEDKALAENSTPCIFAFLGTAMVKSVFKVHLTSFY